MRVAKAETIHDPVEDGVILIDQTVPKFITLGAAEEFFWEEAIMLCDLLYRTLPGGTFDRLLAEMLRKRASSLVVPLPLPKGEEQHVTPARS